MATGIIAVLALVVAAIAIGAVITLAIVVGNPQRTSTLQEHHISSNKLVPQLYTLAFVKYTATYYESHGIESTVQHDKNLNNIEDISRLNTKSTLRYNIISTDNEKNNW